MTDYPIQFKLRKHAKTTGVWARNIAFRTLIPINITLYYVCMYILFQVSMKSCHIHWKRRPNL
jgi:hypothetical protein